MERRKTDRRLNQALDQYVLDIRDLFKQVWRRKLLTALLIAAPTFLGFVYLVTRPDVYQSTASVVLEDNTLNLADVQDAFPGMTPDTMTIDTEVREINSANMMREVIRKFGIHKDDSGELVPASLAGKKETPAENEAAPTPAPAAATTTEESPDRFEVLTRYAQQFAAIPAKASHVIELTYKSTNPYASAEIVNAHAKEYVESQLQDKKERGQQLNNWISEQVAILKKQSVEKATAVQKYREEKGMIKGRNEDDLIYQQVSDIAAELIPVQASKADLQARYDGALAAGTENNISTIQNSGVIQSLKSQESAARQELRGLSAKYGKNHPLYIEAQRKLSQIQGDLSHETRSIKDTLKNELDTVTAQETLLNEKLTEMKARADELRQNQIELQSLEQEADASSKLLDSFIARYEEVTSQLDFARPNARILSLADIPMEPLGTKKPLTMVVILFLSTVLAFLIVFLISLADRGIQSVEEVKKLLNLRMLGILPDVRNPVAEILGNSRSTYLEEIKRIYLHLSGKPSVKTILVTAASTGEGKTSMTLALAAYLVSAGRKTIVVDADILTPDVARLAGINDAPGLSEVLSGKAELAAVIRRDDRGVSIIPAGSHLGGKIDLTTSSGFRTVLEALKSSYDYVLIDSAPVLDSTDAETVAGLVDQVIMVVAYSRTSKKNLKKAADTLRQFSIEVPSVILNKADLKNVA